MLRSSAEASRTNAGWPKSASIAVARSAPAIGPGELEAETRLAPLIGLDGRLTDGVHPGERTLHAHQSLEPADRRDAERQCAGTGVEAGGTGIGLGWRGDHAARERERPLGGRGDRLLPASLDLGPRTGGIHYLVQQRLKPIEPPGETRDSAAHLDDALLDRGGVLADLRVDIGQRRLDAIDKLPDVRPRCVALLEHRPRLLDRLVDQLLGALTGAGEHERDLIIRV